MHPHGAEREEDTKNTKPLTDGVLALTLHKLDERVAYPPALTNTSS